MTYDKNINISITTEEIISLIKKNIENKLTKNQHNYIYLALIKILEKEYDTYKTNIPDSFVEKSKKYKDLLQEYEDYIESSAQCYNDKVEEFKVCYRDLSESYDLLSDCVNALMSGTNQDQELMAGSIEHFLEHRK